MDWKYPCHNSRPPPIEHLLSEVKNEHELKGNLRFGLIQITTLRAYHGLVRDLVGTIVRTLTIIDVRTALSWDSCPLMN